MAEGIQMQIRLMKVTRTGRLTTNRVELRHINYGKLAVVT